MADEFDDEDEGWAGNWEASEAVCLASKKL
jgi:hypothetical protein